MNTETGSAIYDYQKKEVTEFRLCADCFGDKQEKIYRLYCPYVIGYWEFKTLTEMTDHLIETKNAMKNGEAPGVIFSAQRGLRSMKIKCRTDTWKNNMLHTKRGSFYSAYISFMTDCDAGDVNNICFLDNESHHILYSAGFNTASALTDVLTEIETIYARAYSTRELRELFLRYRKNSDQRKSYDLHSR